MFKSWDRPAIDVHVTGDTATASVLSATRHNDLNALVGEFQKLREHRHFLARPQCLNPRRF